MYILFKLVDIVVGILMFAVNHVNGFKNKFIAQLKELARGLSEEKKETKEMLKIYRSYLNQQATKDEMKVANKQLRDIMKTMGLGVLLVLPFSVLTLPILVKVGERLGVNILPSSFAKGRSPAEETVN